MGVGVRQATGIPNGIYNITGLESTNSTLAPMFTTPSVEGIYVGAYSNSPTFDFANIFEYVSKIPTVGDSGEWGQISAASLGNLSGFYNDFNSVIVKVSGITSTNTFIAKAWSCVEYQLNGITSLNDYATSSPPYDPLAMRIYRETILGLPIAVRSRDNANFWNRVLQIMKAITGALS